jgi:hypothetical protein
VEKQSMVWCKSSHRIKMTEKINRESKERHAKMASLWGTDPSVQIRAISGRNKPKEKENNP